MILKKDWRSNSRRGVSTVVGALLFTVLMIAAFSVLSLALDVQTDIVSTQRMVTDVEIKKQQERFGVAAVTDSNNTLSINVNNIGQNPVEISSIWITNKTLTDQPTKRFDIDYDDAFISSGFTSDILKSKTLTLVPDTYDIKIISSFGTIKTIELTVGLGTSGGLRAEIVTDPPDVIIGQNVTIAMIVTNTGESLIEDVIPNALTFTPTGSGSVLASSSHTPVSADLNSGASVMFTWDYQVTGNSGDQLTFSSFAQGNSVELGTVSSNIVSDTSVLREPTDGGSGETINILTDELLARPQLFMTVPGPDGDSGYNALWGVNVVNPVNAPMSVSKITILLTGPGITGNGNLFDCGAGSLVTVEGPSNWSCPNPDTLMWENTASPTTIPPLSVQSFSVLVEPDQHTGQPGNMEAINVQTNVFTTAGSFGKSGYQTTMHTADMVAANVYLSDVVDSISSTNMKTSRLGILPNSIQTFNIVFADLDGNTSTYINNGQLIINVPRGWTDVSVLNNSTSGFVNPAVITAFGDGSHQIVATLPSCSGISCMGGSIGNPSNTIQFSARAPDVTTDHMYVMYVLATGEANDAFTVGTLSEIVLRVDVP